METIRRKNGTLIHTMQNVIVARDPAGNIIQHRGLILDITELRKSQIELQRERDFNARILENTRSLIFVTTPEGNISYSNNRALHALGATAAEVLGKPLLGFAAAEGRRAWAEALRVASLGEQSGTIELQMAGEGNAVLTLSANVSPVADEQQHVTSIVVVLTDPSETVALQSKLAQTEKLAAVGQLVRSPRFLDFPICCSMTPPCPSMRRRICASSCRKPSALRPSSKIC
jgi:PAS domain S-box-containing protein